MDEAWSVEYKQSGGIEILLIGQLGSGLSMLDFSKSINFVGFLGIQIQVTSKQLSQRASVRVVVGKVFLSVGNYKVLLYSSVFYIQTRSTNITWNFLINGIDHMQNELRKVQM